MGGETCITKGTLFLEVESKCLIFHSIALTAVCCISLYNPSNMRSQHRVLLLNGYSDA